MARLLESLAGAPRPARRAPHHAESRDRPSRQNIQNGDASRAPPASKIIKILYQKKPSILFTILSLLFYFLYMIHNTTEVVNSTAYNNDIYIYKLPIPFL